MKTARIILAIIAICAIISSILSFETRKFNGLQIFTFTDEYLTFSTRYTRANPAILPASPLRFFTTIGGIFVSYYSATSIVPGQTVTLTRVGGTETITFPSRQGIIIVNTYTTLAN